VHEKKEEHMIEIIPGMPENIVAVSAKGKVTGEDFVIPCPVKIFPNERLSEAKTWVSQ
jgi:hypothetical protein